MRPSTNLEHKFLKSGYGRIIGIDEVGMGCLAGPVVVCAVSLKKDFYKIKNNGLKGIADSKLLSAKKREELASKLIRNKYLEYKINLCQPKTIDRLNIHKASKLAMKKAVEGIARADARAIVLVDGPHEIPNLKIKQKAIIKGDRKIFAIACASIIAKVHRDKLMAKYGKKYPHYGFEKHKGYGTKYHYAQLASFGPSDIHRRSFRLD
jgi:ribonuclease HII